MKYDIELYRHAIIPQIKDWMIARPDETPESQIGLIAITTECPIICVAYFMIELYGDSESLRERIKRLEAFYD